jgi:hypothetical protein
MAKPVKAGPVNAGGFMLMPSNFGSGAAGVVSIKHGGRASELTRESQFGGERASRLSLVLADQTQSFGKVLLGQETTVLGVGQGPDLAEDGFGNSGALEELDGSVTGDDSGAAFVAFAKQLGKKLSFVRGVVEGWMGSWAVSRRGLGLKRTYWKLRLQPFCAE